jgi:hypothetical protein
MIEYHPAIESTCSSLWEGEAYRVSVSSTIAPPASVQAGIVSTCNTYTVVKSGRFLDLLLFELPFKNAMHYFYSRERPIRSIKDGNLGGSCAAIESSYILTFAQFLAWNPCSGLKLSISRAGGCILCWYQRSGDSYHYQLSSRGDSTRSYANWDSGKL